MGEKPTEADDAAEAQKTWLPANFRREAGGAPEQQAGAGGEPGAAAAKAARAAASA